MKVMITFHNKVNQTFISSLPNKWLTIPTKGGEAADRGAAEQLPQGRVREQRGRFIFF